MELNNLNLTEFSTPTYNLVEKYVTESNCISMCESYIQLTKTQEYLIFFMLVVIFLLYLRLLYFKHKYI